MINKEGNQKNYEKNKFALMLHKLFTILLFIGILSATNCPTASAQSLSASRKDISIDSVMIRKTFPILSLFIRDKNLRKIIRDDKNLQKIEGNNRKRITNSLQSCADVNCYTKSILWDNEEVKNAGNEIIRLYKKNKKFRSTIDSLKKEGSYELYTSLPDTAFLRKAWNDAANGINYILDVYVEGRKPVYAKIDAISFEKGDSSFKNEVSDSIQSELQRKSRNLYFDLPLQIAIDALRINGREESAWYEPLNEGLNKLPYAAIKNKNWNNYKYSMILVPGLGPEIKGVSLDPGGAKRCDEAYLRFRKGLAPFIVVSGGHVHPNKTPFCEAIEMKKYLVEKLGVPDSAVFIEPHARHTTTNIRNVSRMIFQFGIPADKPVLIVTDSSQDNYIVKRMSKVAMRDLGYLPYKEIKQLNDQEIEFYPLSNSLQVNPLDPLDP